MSLFFESSKKKPADSTALVKNNQQPHEVSAEPTSAGSAAENLIYSPPPTDSAVTGSSAPKSQGANKNAAPSSYAGEPGTAPRTFNFSQPDRPFRPHFFRPEAELLGTSATIYISADAFKRMLLFVEIAGKEVGWLGTVQRLENGDFLIEKVFLLEQEVTSAETELSVDGQNKLTNKLVEQGDEGIEQVNRLRFWGHSHVRMGTTPSGTDERTMQRFGREGLPWYIRGIFNKLGRADFSIHYYEQGFRVNDAPWAVYDAETGTIIDAAQFNKAEYARTSQPVWTPAPSPSQSTTPTDAVPPVAPPVVPPAAPTAWSPRPPQSSLLPEILRPSAALRAEVQAEFAAKVTERKDSVVSWFGSLFGSDAPDTPDLSQEKPASTATGQSQPPQVPAAGANTNTTAPTDTKRTDTAKPEYDPVTGNRINKPRPTPGNQHSSADKKEPKGFWDWLLGT